MMNDPVMEELLSAYLDGEATADEQELVERALDEDAALRRLYHDLQALQGAIRQLPRHRLGDGFASEVMNLAKERAAHDSSDNGDDSGPEEPRTEKVAVVAKEPAKAIPFDRRRWVAGLGTLAATLAVIMLIFLWPAPAPGPIGKTDPDPPDNGRETQVADDRQDAPDAPVDAPKAPMQHDLAPEDRNDSTERIVDSGADEAAPKQSPDAPSPKVAPKTKEQIAETRPTKPKSSSPSPPKQGEQVAKADRPKPPQVNESRYNAARKSLDLNYAARRVHVLRLATTVKQVRNRTFDQLIERQGIQFGLEVGRAPTEEEFESRMARVAQRKLDLVALEAGRAQVRGLIADLKDRQDDFRVLAVYETPAKSYSDLIVRHLETLLEAEPESSDPTLYSPNVPPAFSTPGISPGNASPERRQAILAWRPMYLTWKDVDDLFPLPDPNKKSPDEPREVGDGNYTVRIVVVMQVETEQE